MLEIKNIKKSFDKNEILKGIDLVVNDGDVISILGPSGSGKTTFLRGISFLDRPDEGTIDFDGNLYNMEKLTKKQILDYRRKIGFVFQNYNLFINKTALENVTEGLIMVKHMKKKDAIIKGREALKKVGLLDKANFYPSKLSGGQQQRVAIARAIALDPSVIFFDEPTSALDPELTREVLIVIKQLAEEGITMIIVTHEMEFAREVSDRIIFMENGVVVEDSNPKEFFEKQKNERISNFINTNSGLGVQYMTQGMGI